VVSHINRELGNTEECTVEVHGFTAHSPANPSQLTFLEHMRAAGFNIHTYGTHEQAFLADMLLVGLGAVDRSKPHHLVFVTNEYSARRIVCTAQTATFGASVAYFSEDIPSDWTTDILNEELDFINLSSATIRDSLRLPRKAP
jgi:hypothetical protein